MTYDPAECMVYALTGMTSKERKSVRAKAIKFPLKLMYVLECLDYQDVITWNPDGTSFTIINPIAFEQRVLPEIFKQAKFASFQRKLTRWSFVRAGKVSSECSYSHPEFLRGEWDLCSKLNSSDKDDTAGSKSNPPLALELLRARNKHVSQMQLMQRRQAVMATGAGPGPGPGAAKKNSAHESCGTTALTTMLTQGLEIPHSGGVTSSQSTPNDPSSLASLTSLINEAKCLGSQQQYSSALVNAAKDELLLSLLREQEMKAKSNSLLGISSAPAQTEQQILENLLRMRTQPSTTSIMGSPYAPSTTASILGATKQSLMDKILRLTITPSHITEARSLLSAEGASLGGGAFRRFDSMPSATVCPESLSMPLTLSNYNPSSLLRPQPRNHGMNSIQKDITTGVNLSSILSNPFSGKEHIMKRAYEALERSNSKHANAMPSDLGQQELAGNIHSPSTQQVQASLEAHLLARKMGHLPSFK